jgi:hypothetical protein
MIRETALVCCSLVLLLALAACSDDSSCDFCPANATCSTSLYVRQGTSGGDGSSASSPLGTLQAAADKAKAGDCILVAPGSYGAVALPGGVSLLGAGRDKVSIAADASGSPALRVSGAGEKGGQLRGFRVDGSSTSRGLSLATVSELRVVDVEVVNALGVAVFADTCSGLVLEDLTVAALVLRPPADAGVADADSPDAGSPDAGSPDAGSPDAGSPDAGSPDAGSPDAGSPDAGSPDTSPVDATLGDSATPPPPPVDLGFGIGIAIKASGSATLRRVTVSGSKTQGIVASATALTLEATRVSDSGYQGIAIDCGDGAACSGPSSLSDVTVERSQGAGIWLRGGEAKLTRVTIDGVAPHALGSVAMGLVASNVAMTVEASTIKGSASQGAVLSRCSGSIDGLEVLDSGERGVWLQDITKPLTLENLQVRRATLVGLGMIGSTVEITGSRFEEIAEGTQFDGGKLVQVGDGVQSLDGSKLTLRGTRITGAQRLGVLLDASSAIVEKNVIQSVQPQLVQQNKSTLTASDNKDGSGAAIQATVDPQNAFDVVVTRFPVGDAPIPIP